MEARDRHATENDVETAYNKLRGVIRAYVGFLFDDVEKGRISASDAKELCGWMHNQAHAFRMLSYDGE